MKENVVKNGNKALSVILKLTQIALGAIILAFFAGILFINFKGRQFYNMDMYADTYLATLMGKANSLFPEGWIFGNQYYGFATPTIAALIYKIIPDGFYAMATASTIMTVAIFAAFTMCFRKFSKKSEIFVGVFALLCLILGNSAASAYQGMQLFYTMASYYACYLIGILVTLKIYLELVFGKIDFRVQYILFPLILNFLLGINSVRELLVLNIPLLAIEALRILWALIKKKKVNFASVSFAALAFVAEICGVITVKLLHVSQTDILKDSGAFTLQTLKDNLKVVLTAIMDITGLSFKTRGQNYSSILYTLAVIIFVMVAIALITMVIKRDRSPLAYSMFYCVLSLAFVALAGTLVIKIRSIYLFVYYLLVALCMMYLYRVTSRHRIVSIALILALGVMGTVNFATNFIPCVKNFEDRNQEKVIIEERLEADGIDTVLVFETTAPTIAMYSNDKITVGTVHINKNAGSDDTAGLLVPLEYLSSKDMYDTDKEYVYIFSSVYDERNYFKRYSPEVVEHLMEQIELVGEYPYHNNSVKLYKCSKDIVSLEFFENR